MSVQSSLPEISSFVPGRATDVLVVGAGPAGLMAAATLARYGVDVRIIDKRPQQVLCGHATGIQPRTLEIMNSLGLVDYIKKHGNIFGETAFWSRQKNELKRAENSPETDIVNSTPYPYIEIMHQGDTETMFNGDLAGRGVSVERPVQYIDHKTNEGSEYSLTAYVKDLNSGIIETVPTKFIIGTDGAMSAVRGVLGVTASVHKTTDVWIVADTFTRTNFPDHRRRCNIRTDVGSSMLIPNANNGLRIYTLLNEEDAAELSVSRYEGKGTEVKNSTTLVEILSRRIKKILAPYSVEILKIDWISMYHIAQRVSKSFADSSKSVFIAGDACHTHSPKAGQGMNVSMNDTYNLTWKISLVLRGLAGRNLLDTYQVERQHIAQQLIDFDEKWSHLFASAEGLDSSEFHDVYVQNKGFTSGCGHQYPPSALTAEKPGVSINQKAADPLTPGKRMLPFNVTRHFSGTRVNILDDMPSNARFHLFIFAGNLSVSGGLDALAKLLQSSTNKYLKALVASGPPPSAAPSVTEPSHALRGPDSGGPKAQNGTRSTESPSAPIDLYCVHTQPHLRTPAAKVLPAPFTPKWEGWVYEDEEGRAHRDLGLSTDVGACVVVRPDGYVGLVTGLNGEGLTEYFGAILDL